MNSQYKYMHTINGKPGMFSGEQICYANSTKHSAVTLADSLSQIKKEQRQSLKYRKANNFYITSDYGWAKVKV